jgi:8-oxo-dGTP pyrophosphatase MutT (NUDIX family)
VADRTLATCLAVLAERGLSAPQAFEHLYLARLEDPQRNPFAYLVLVAPGPIAPAAARVDAALETGLVVDARPGASVASRLTGLATGAQSLDAWVAASASRLDPPSDDRPFFFDLNRALPGLFVSIGLAGVALWLALFLRDRLGAARLAVPGWLSAAALGAGFLLVESGLIARGQFLIGTPTLALVVVIGTILVAASAGSVLGPRVAAQPRRRLALGATLAASVTLVEAAAWPWIASHAPASTGGLVATTAALVAVVGFPVGFCLPSVFELFGARAAASIYAANAIATVAASAGATLVAQAFGLRALFGAAGLCYAGCAVLATRRAYNASMEVAPGLRRHVPADALEGAHLARILGFVATHDRPFDRAIAEGHLTGSALVVSRSGDRVLLLHHKKLGLWLQPGGHGDPGEATGEAVALREALEETGIRGLELHPTAPRPLDVDVHPIPARPNEPAHEHLDLRYLVLAPDSATAVHDPEESHAIRWFTWDEVDAMELDHGLRRALRKVKALL